MLPVWVAVYDPGFMYTAVNGESGGELVVIEFV